MGFTACNILTTAATFLIFFVCNLIKNHACFAKTAKLNLNITENVTKLKLSPPAVIIE